MLQIVWKQKHQSGHGTCDKKILTPPSIRICPLFGELKKGDYFYPPPSHMDQCLLLSNFFFLNASLSKTIRLINSTSFCQFVFSIFICVDGEFCVINYILIWFDLQILEHLMDNALICLKLEFL